MKISDFIDLGYGKKEFSRDIHALVVGSCGILVLGLPPLLDGFSWKKFGALAAATVVMGIVAGVKSYLMHNGPDSPPTGDQK